MLVPAEPKIYHILHWDRLESVIGEDLLWCDAEARERDVPGTTIGMHDVKDMRLQRRLRSHSGLRVGDCVPFNYCPRSVMLYVIFKRNHPDLAYRGGQGPIVHLEADLQNAVAWAEAQERRWAITSANAGSGSADDFKSLARLDRLDWDAIQAEEWSGRRHRKQAEFLMERAFPWDLVSRIGVMNNDVARQVQSTLSGASHRPPVEVMTNWYY